MLTLSDDAAELIRALARKARSSAGSGLRISINDRYDSLTMELAPDALPGDAIVVNRHTYVFLSPAASRRVSGRTLRATVTSERSSFFIT